jgi:hypothetical protein
MVMLRVRSYTAGEAYRHPKRLMGGGGCLFSGGGG